MPGTIQKYVTRILLGSLVLCVALVLGLTVLLDFVQRVDDFSEMLQGGTISGSFIVEFYLIRLPMFAGWLAPIILLAASGVTLIRLNRRNELIPLLMSGLSTHQILLPLYVCFGLGAVTVFSVQEWLLPSLSRRIAATEQRLKEGGRVDDILTVDASGTFLQSNALDLRTSEMRNVTLLTFDRSKLRKITRARRAKWVGPERGWLLSHGRETRYTGEGFRSGSPVSFGKNGDVWPTDLSPDEIITRDASLEFYGLPTLLDMIDKWPYLRSIRMTLHTRLLYPIIAIILPLFAIPVFLGRTTRSYLLGGILIAGIAIGYYLVQLVFLELGNSGVFHPLFAAWTPVILAAGLVMYQMDNVMS